MLQVHVLTNVILVVVIDGRMRITLCLLEKMPPNATSNPVSWRWGHLLQIVDQNKLRWQPQLHIQNLTFLCAAAILIFPAPSHQKRPGWWYGSCLLTPLATTLFLHYWNIQSLLKEYHAKMRHLFLFLVSRDYCIGIMFVLEEWKWKSLDILAHSIDAEV